MQITLQELNMTYPNGKKALQGVSASLDSPSLIGLLGRAVENLLSNAALYSPEGAEIRVTAAARGGLGGADGGKHRGPHPGRGPAPPV